MWPVTPMCVIVACMSFCWTCTNMHHLGINKHFTYNNNIIFIRVTSLIVRKVDTKANLRKNITLKMIKRMCLSAN